MRIRLALLLGDRTYLERFSHYMSGKYPDKLEIFSFTTPEALIAAAGVQRVNVVLAESIFRVDQAALPPKCAFAYFVDSEDIETLNGVFTVNMFQKAELIYKEILNLYAQVAQDNIELRPKNGALGRVITFISASGGAGTSTMAAACATTFAKHGEKTIILNFEHFGTASAFFAGDGAYTFSDVIYSLKSNKPNLNMKLESAVRQDTSGVYYFEPGRSALDVSELSGEEIKKVIVEVKALGYEYIVLDLNFSFDARTTLLLNESAYIVLVSCCDEVSSGKTKRLLDAVRARDEIGGAALFENMLLLRNRVPKMNTGDGYSGISGLGISELGAVPYLNSENGRALAAVVESSGVFDRLRT